MSRTRTTGSRHRSGRSSSGPLGVTNIRTFVNPENPTQVGVLMDVPDMDAVMATLQTEAGAQAMAHDGVLPETLVVLVER